MARYGIGIGLDSWPGKKGREYDKRGRELMFFYLGIVAPIGVPTGIPRPKHLLLIMAFQSGLLFDQLLDRGDSGQAA
jgi:hypothetical protein